MKVAVKKSEQSKLPDQHIIADPVAASGKLLAVFFAICPAQVGGCGAGNRQGINVIVIADTCSSHNNTSGPFKHGAVSRSLSLVFH